MDAIRQLRQKIFSFGFTNLKTSKSSGMCFTGHKRGCQTRSASSEIDAIRLLRQQFCSFGFTNLKFFFDLFYSLYFFQSSKFSLDAGFYLDPLHQNS
jgi:hypothetical protein